MAKLAHDLQIKAVGLRSVDQTPVDSSWEREAENWVRWVRRPGHDSYWYYRASFFDEIVPSPRRRTLEMGCGEGRVARDLAARKHRVTGIDSSPTLLSYAREADPDGTYELADAASLPFADASFDLVVAYNSLMDFSDMPGAVREAARVLEPGGRLCISVTHPLNDAGIFESSEPDAPFVIRGSYFGRQPFEARQERDGLQMTFRGWTYALEDYWRAFEAAAFVVERLREPAASDEQVSQHAPSRRWQRVPLLLQLRAVKR